MNDPAPTDGELLAVFASRQDAGAFEALVRRHGPLVLGVCRRIVGSAQDAEDAAQAVFLILARKAGQLDRRRPLAPWLHHVARGVACDARKAAQIRLAHEKEVALMTPRTLDEEGRTWARMQPDIDEALDRLPEKVRVALILHHVEGCSQEDIARLDGSKPSAVSMRLTRGREMLRTFFLRRGTVLPTGLFAALLSREGLAAELPPFFPASAAAAAGGTGAASPAAVLLAKGAIRAMFWVKAKVAAALLAAVFLIAAGGGVGWRLAVTAAPSEPPLGIFWASDPVRPGEVVLLQGSGFSDKTIVEVARLEDGPASVPAAPAEPRAWTRTPVIQASDVSLKFAVPAEWKPGVVACRVAVNGSVSPVRWLNAPDPWWVQGDAGETASAGGWIRILGKNLDFEGLSSVRLEPEQGAAVTLKPAAADGYSIRLLVPADFRPGTFRLLAHNGRGGASSWREAGRLQIQSRPDWPVKVFSVLDSAGADAAAMRKTLVKYRPVQDMTAGIQAALRKAKENGGGVVYFPAGRYGVRGELAVPPKTVLRGEGTGLVVLWWGGGRFNLDGGDAKGYEFDENEPKPPANLISGRDFAIEDMSLYLPREYQTAIAGGENVRLRRLIVRIDHSWTLHTKRQEGCVARLGKNCEVSDCDIQAKGTGLVPGPYNHVARNRVMAGKTNCPLGGAQQVIVEDNHFVSTHPTAYMNIAGQGKNFYFARNRLEALNVHQADYSFTYDAGATAYDGRLAEVAGKRLTLASEPDFPSWAGEKSPLWKQAIVCILDGKGAGQWRAVTAHEGKIWEIDRPWDCAPDRDSMVTIVPFNGLALVIGNRFEDANWVNAGYGTSIDVVYAGNRLVRCAQLLNYGLVMKRGCFPSWYVQYLDNEITEGHTTIDTTGSTRDNEQYKGPITRGVVLRRNRFSKDNSGGISVSGHARDVIVEGCVLGHPMGTIRADGEAQGLLFRRNVFEGGGARYEGKRLDAAVIQPAGKP